MILTSLEVSKDALLEISSKLSIVSDVVYNDYTITDYKNTLAHTSTI